MERRYTNRERIESTSDHDTLKIQYHNISVRASNTKKTMNIVQYDEESSTYMIKL